MGLYPGREAVADSQTTQKDGFRSAKDYKKYGDAYRTLPTTVSRTDYSTGIPTLFTTGNQSIKSYSRDPVTLSFKERDLRAERAYMRPEGWTEQGGMKDVQIYNLEGGKYVKYIPYSKNGQQSNGIDPVFYDVSQYLD